MEKRKLGNSDLEITRLGFGAWAIGGGGWVYGWGPQDDQDSAAAIQRALDLGVNWIDTAPVYGLGHSETVVGNALKHWSGSARPYIFTKCSLVWDDRRELGNSLKADSIRRECEASLKRLNIDAIDLYQVHWPNPDSDIEEGWTEMARLKAEGKVRHIGVSNFNVEQMRRAQQIAPITSLQPPYSMLRRGIEAEILPYAKEQNIGVIAYSPMLSGLLTGAMSKERTEKFAADDWRRNNKEFQEPRLSRNLALADLLREIGKPHGSSAGEVAVAWALRHPAVTAVIVGSRSADQFNGIAGAADLKLSDAEVARIEEFIEQRVNIPE